MVLAYPVDKQHRIVLVTPGRKPPAPPEISIAGDAFHLTTAVKRVGDTLTIDYRLNSVGEMIEPARIEAFRNDVLALNNAKSWDLDLTSTQGGTIGREHEIWGVAVVAVVALLLLAATVFGLRWGLKADDAYAAEGRYYPVSLPKFVLMNLATIGFYGFFWMWKCWRWTKAHRGQPIAPFWRALFGGIWLYPLFKEVNRKLAGRALATGLGVATAVGYLAISIAQSAASRLGAPTTAVLLLVAQSACLLPAATAVVRQNESGPETLRRNSAFTRHTAAALVAGALYWVLVIAGLQAD